MGYEVEESQAEEIKTLRKEIIALEREVGDHCKTIMSLQEELKNIKRGGDHASDRKAGD